MIREGIVKLVEGKDLSLQEAQSIMREIMSGEATPAQIASFLTALRIKGETVDEIVGMASVMRDLCIKVELDPRMRAIDVCGTGGDSIKTFNISTVCGFVVAGAGIPVAKHGGRSVTSRCGSADVMEQLGYNLSSGPELVKKMIERIGIGFMYAPIYHPAMKYAMGPRREIGIRTVFNILGPLVNPAQVKAQLVGVFDRDYVTILAECMRRLGVQEAMVVHGLDGMDELSTIGGSYVAWLRDGEIRNFTVFPRDLGMATASKQELAGSDPQGSSEILFRILAGIEKGPRRDIVLLNASAGIVVGGRADSLAEGLEIAAESLESGRAYAKLKQLISMSGGSLAKLEAMETKYGIS